MLKIGTGVKDGVVEKHLPENKGGASATADLSPVALALDRQRTYLGHLDCLIAQLSVRLSPVCSDRPVCGKELDKGIAGESALLRTIEDHNSKLADASDKISYIISSLEV